MFACSPKAQRVDPRARALPPVQGPAVEGERSAVRSARSSRWQKCVRMAARVMSRVRRQRALRGARYMPRGGVRRVCV